MSEKARAIQAFKELNLNISWRRYKKAWKKSVVLRHLEQFGRLPYSIVYTKQHGWQILINKPDQVAN